MYEKYKELEWISNSNSWMRKAWNVIHTVGPASKEVPESAIAAQSPAQNPDKHILN